MEKEASLPSKSSKKAVTRRGKKLSDVKMVTMRITREIILLLGSRRWRKESPGKYCPSVMS